MPSADERRSSATTRQGLIKKPFSLPNSINQPSTVEQSPFPDRAPTSAGLLRRAGYAPSAGSPRPLSEPDRAPTSTGLLRRAGYNPSPGLPRPLSEPVTLSHIALPATEPTTSPRVTQHLPEYDTSPHMTRPLDLQTAILPYIKGNTTTSLRQPVVIRGTGKKSTGPKRPPQRRRWVVQIAVTSLVILISITALLSVVPIDNEGDHILNPFQSISNLVQINGGNPNLVAQQATATAFTQQDGYDPSSGLAGNASADDFPYGQCTYWADFRYHQATGRYISWRGDADAWAYGAGQSGWVVSSKPRVPSIIVLQPGVQGAGWLGHVAVVERINPDGSVYTSNMNWYANGGWGRISYWIFTPGPGVSFVWV